MSSADEILGEGIEMQDMDDPAKLSRKELMKKRCAGLVEYVQSVNDRINRSTFGRVFRLKGSGHVSSLVNLS